MTRVTPDPITQPGPLLLPEGTRLLHIGPHKTGTTAVQAALYSARASLLEQGVRHAGRSRNPASAVRAVTGQLSPYSDEETPPISHWRALVRDVTAAREPRVVVSSEFFAWAEPDVIRRIVVDLDPARVHVAVTLRPLSRILPSHWQQNVQAGAVGSFDAWLDGLFIKATGKAHRNFWHLHRHDQLIARWAEIVGPQNVTAIVVDDRDHAFVLRAFEQLLGLREGTLAAVPDLANRSLTLPEAEAVRAFNTAFKAEAVGKAVYARVMRFGAAQVMKLREPAPDEARVEVPGWALDRAGEIAAEMVAAIATSGVRVAGDLDALARAPGSGRAGDDKLEVEITPEIAASMAMGVLVATGAARHAQAPGSARVAEPIELARVPTYQVAGVVVLRARHAVVTRWQRAIRRLTRPLRRARRRED